jgi:2-phosphosulfolactate phosphatase
VRIDGFDLGNSPREYLEPRTSVLAMSTTNGTRAIVTAAERCDRVVVASLLTLAAVVAEVAEHGEDVAVFCAGVKGDPCLDDTYVAGRIAESLACERTDAAEMAVRLVHSFASAEEAFRQSRSGRNLINNGPELESDIPWCAQESVLAVVPRFVGMHGVAAEIRAE